MLGALGHEPSAPGRSSSRTTALEAFSLALAPLLAYLVLRVRIMSPVSIVDQSIHSTYIFDPRDMLTRYGSVFGSTARLREAFRAGFLVPARLAYLAFGAVPGFLCLRYLLALAAVGPSYLLLRRLYGRPAGALCVIVILSCPVIITAWGTDYPDSAAVAYLLGGLACFAMPSERRRRMWLVLGGGFFALAAWALAVSIPLILVTLGVYVLIRLRRDRDGLLLDAAAIAAVAVLVTGLLAVGSYFMIGKADFVGPTIRSILYLNTPAEKRLYHSTSLAWVPYVKYLLVLPAVVVAWLAAFAGRLRRTTTSQLFVGLSCAAQVVISAYLQFFGNVETLEQRFFSTLLWGGVVLALSITLAELSSSLARRTILRFVPAAVVLVVPLLYETDPRVPSTPWSFGVALAAGVVVAALAGRLLSARQPRLSGRLLTTAVMVVITGATLVLEVTPSAVPALPGVVRDPQSGYAGALGGSATMSLEAYRAESKLRAWVPNASYHGEQLMMWFESYLPLRAEVGLFHGYINSLPSPLGVLDRGTRKVLGVRRPAEILFLSRSGENQFERALRALGAYHPRLVKHAIIRSGNYAVFVWLVQLDNFLRR